VLGKVSLSIKRRALGLAGFGRLLAFLVFASFDSGGGMEKGI